MQPPTPDDPEMDPPAHTGMPPNAVWTRFLTDGEPVFRTIKSVLGRLPANPRCKVCYAPFTGIGGQLMRWIGKGRARKKPLFCAACEQFVQKHPGGAEVELTMLFVDVRGSTALAETMRAEAFSQLLNRFYAAASTVLITCDALIDKFVGDEVIGLFIPGFTGPAHAQKAVEAAHQLLQVTGYASPHGPWIPIGIGIHTGTAYVGTVMGTHGTAADFTALGDNVNVTARLASHARSGEALVSTTTAAAAHVDVGGLEQRTLELKGKSKPTAVYVLRLAGMG